MRPNMPIRPDGSWLVRCRPTVKAGRSASTARSTSLLDRPNCRAMLSKAVPPWADWMISNRLNMACSSPSPLWGAAARPDSRGYRPYPIGHAWGGRPPPGSFEESHARLAFALAELDTSRARLVLVDDDRVRQVASTSVEARREALDQDGLEGGEQCVERGIGRGRRAGRHDPARV